MHETFPLRAFFYTRKMRNTAITYSLQFSLFVFHLQTEFP